jgi:hypothetical protein
MKLPIIILAVLILLVVGCATVQNPPLVPTSNTTSAISGNQDLLLSEQDLEQLGMSPYLNNPDLEQAGITFNGTPCNTGVYETSEYSPLMEESLCSYIINSLSNTSIFIQLSRYTTLEALNGSYQYGSSHLYSAEGLISENDYGDQSRFRVSDEHDYGGEFNDPNITYYHLWICKDTYMIHITSKGSKDAKEYIEKTGRLFLSKLG